ncbi:PREDICTED: prostaglandin E2 receptor EP4 subtype-like [Branchiostoma belcheri]|uniref:Prostaglandin E2 receptor EP4 subtype-like n=1 Tax=Branchiostoma belcheri TaxID=7741 RepID=A0A6P4YX39_BRABE|nr:PREDICTED: prostaglandin E2 receptor EP4 subtype-like [Branchiostoma belcheri]
MATTTAGWGDSSSEENSGDGNNMLWTTDTTVNVSDVFPLGVDREELGEIVWWLASTTIIIVAVVGLFGNSLIIVVSREIYRQRPTMPNLLLIYLSWTDVLNCSLGVTPLALSYYFNIYVNQAMCDFNATVLLALSVASQMIVALMSVDRYWALLHPFSYNRHFGYDKSKIYPALVFIFLYTMVVSFLPLFGLVKNVPQYPNSYCMFDWTDDSPTGRAVVYINVVNMFLCLFIIVVVNAFVAAYMFRLRRVRPRLPSRDSEVAGVQECRLELQMARLTLVVAVAFFCSWFLFATRILANQIGGWPDKDLDYLGARLMTFNSVINPVLYIIMRKPCRKGCWMIIKSGVHYVTFKMVAAPTMTLAETVAA